MGHWSAWITPDPTEFGSRGYSMAMETSDDGVSRGVPPVQVAYDEDVNLEIGRAVAAAREAPYAIADTASVGGAVARVTGSKNNTWNPYTTGEAQVGQQLYTVAPLGDPLTYRDWFPNLLRSLTEGVDYAAIPGKDPLRDDDAYVEYESGANTIIGWAATWETTLLVFSLAVEQAQQWDVPPPLVPNSFPLRLATGPATYDPRTEAPADGSDVTDEWDAHPYGWGDTALELAPLDVTSGDVVAVENDIPVTVPITLADPTAMAFALVIQTSLHNPAATPPQSSGMTQGTGASSSSSVSLTQEARFPTFAQGSSVVCIGPAFTFQMPRWRYWIPTDEAPEYYPGRKIDPLMDLDGLGRNVDVNFSG